MKRDMDIVRFILQRVEADAALDCPDYTEKQIIYHIAIMKDAALLDAQTDISQEGEIDFANVSRLTWAGHEFLDATRDTKIWQRAKEHVIKPGFSWTFQTLLEFLKREIEQRWLGGGPATP